MRMMSAAIPRLRGLTSFRRSLLISSGVSGLAAHVTNRLSEHRND